MDASPAVQGLYLSHNQLTGTIPEHWQMPSGLQVCYGWLTCWLAYTTDLQQHFGR